MTRVLVTGGSGFIAAHVVETLLARGHTVVTTVRSREKGNKILETHPNHGKDKLDYVVVEDISQSNAFDTAVNHQPPLEAVIHCASPYHFKADAKEKIHELISTAVNGTVGILNSIYLHAPEVKRVVVTSSFAAIVDSNKSPTYTYSEEDWDPITENEALVNPMNAYRASKTFAEKAAWDFVSNKKPNFTLATCNPPLVLGPIIHDLTDLANINTSNARFRDLITGAAQNKCPPTGNHLWTDVRDLALAHVLAMEKSEAAGQRFFVTAGNFCNAEIVEIIRQEFPEFKSKLPESEEALKSGKYPEQGYYGYKNGKSLDLLGVTYRELRESVIDSVRSIVPLLG